jgi:hypothetical protein
MDNYKLVQLGLLVEQYEDFVIVDDLIDSDAASRYVANPILRILTSAKKYDDSYSKIPPYFLYDLMENPNNVHFSSMQEGRHLLTIKSEKENTRDAEFKGGDIHCSYNFILVAILIILLLLLLYTFIKTIYQITNSLIAY